MNACSFGFHKWTKWSTPEMFKVTIRYVFDNEFGSSTVDTLAQERECSRCGKNQIKRVGK